MTTLFLGKPCWAYILVKRNRPGNGYDGTHIGLCAIWSGSQWLFGTPKWGSHSRGSAVRDKRKSAPFDPARYGLPAATRAWQCMHSEP